MKLTNIFGLPRAVENAIRNDSYSRGNSDISVTGLISPARKRALEIKHQDEITEDVAEKLWSLLGQIVHKILERADVSESIREERLYIERHGWRVSGQFDRLCLEEVEDDEYGSGIKVKRMCADDWKLVSTYAIKDGPKPEWRAQLNIYALMLREHGYTVDKLRIIAILRDWSKSKARHTPDYPQVPVIALPVQMWAPSETEDYIKSRLIAHGRAQHELPECTPEERWQRPVVWALHKTGVKRAISLHSTRDEAEVALEGVSKINAKANYTIDLRPAEQLRCADYCPALPFCELGKALLKKTEDFYSERNVWVVRPGRADQRRDET